MTNHLGDMQNSEAIIIFGANPAANHPIAMQHILAAKEKKNATIIVIDPRYSRTAAKSDIYCRIRTGTDIAFMYGMIRLIRDNKWYDKKFLNDRVYGIEEIFKECEQYTPEVVEDITGCPKEILIQATAAYAKAKPGCLIWNQGWTQHTIGSSNTRMGPIIQLLLGNMGVEGGGTNILRGHDNVQGGTDMGCLADTLPGYYGLAEGSWKYFSERWKLDYDWVKSRFKSKEMMEAKGFSLSLWLHGVLDEANAKNNAGTPLKALVCIGNGISTITMTHKVKEALDKLDMVVFIDPYVNDAAVITTRNDNLFLLPAASQIETSGTTVNTGRSAQWRFKVVDPLYEARPDHEILFDFAKRMGFYEQYTRALGDGKGNFQWPEDATREIARTLKTIGLQGWLPERIKAQTENWHMFDTVSLAGYGPMKNQYYGLPWPCWTEDHSGSPVLYNINKPVSQGGMGFRNRFGLEHNGSSLLAGAGSAPKGSSVKGGYPEITGDNIESLGIKLTDKERELVKGKNWKNDNSGILNKKAIAAGLVPYGNARARTIVWNFIDPVPKHREPLHSIRTDLIKKYPASADNPNHFRTAVRYLSEQTAQDWAKDFPVNIVSGRLVEHMGTGTETRASKYLSELAGEMYGEIHPELGAKLGIRDGEMMWVHGTAGGKIKIKAKYGYSVLPDQVFLPQNFSGMWQGEHLGDRYPEGTAPHSYGENSNQVTSYGYDQQTSCPETKCSLVRIEKA